MIHHIDWFLYDRDLLYERVKENVRIINGWNKITRNTYNSLRTEKYWWICNYMFKFNNKGRRLICWRCSKLFSKDNSKVSVACVVLFGYGDVIYFLVILKWKSKVDSGNELCMLNWLFKQWQLQTENTFELSLTRFSTPFCSAKEITGFYMKRWNGLKKQAHWPCVLRKIVHWQAGK